MEFLLHTDVLIDAFLSTDANPSFQTILEDCRLRKFRIWTHAASLSVLKDKAGKKLDQKGNLLEQILKQIPILPISGSEYKQAMRTEEESFDVSVSAHAVGAFGLEGVITLNPALFQGKEINAVLPDDLSGFMNGLPVPSVPLLRPTASYPEIWEDLEKAVVGVLRTGRFILGVTVSDLEEKIAAYCQSKFAVGVSSGTDALMISLMAAGVGPGDEVITTPFTFFATVGSIDRIGAKAVFVDIEPESFNIDPASVQDKITAKTRAILPVHLYGQCADMDGIKKIADSNKLTVIEDAAQAIGSEYKFKRAGSFGDYGCFSFFPTKNLGGFGDGGIVTTSSEEAYDRLKLLRVHGGRPKYYHKVIGGNFRLDAFQAAVVSSKLPYLEGWTKKRRENAERYRKEFKERGMTDRIQLPFEIFPRHIYNQFVIRVAQKRDALKEFLGQQGVATEIYYPVPLHMQECFAHLGYREGDFPVSEQAAKETLALPISQEVTAREQIKVVEAIQSFFS